MTSGETGEVSDKASTMLDWVRWYAGSRLDPLRMDERRTLPLSLVADFADAGLLGLLVPEHYQGQELSWSDTVRICTQLGAIDCNLFVLVGVHNTLGTPPVQLFAAESVGKEILPLLAKGTLITSAVSEPGMGSDLRSITTRAVRRHDGSYTINGVKKWISLGGDARYVNVVADLYDEFGENIGMTGFLVDSTSKGFIVGPEELTLGLKAIPQNTLTFENLHVPAENLLGQEGEGLRVAKTAFSQGRLILAAGGLGAMMRVLELAHRFAARRNVATGRLAENGRTQQILSECVSATQVVDMVVRHIATQLDVGEDVPELLYFTAKTLGCELAWQVVDTCVQLLGARGYLDTNIVGKFFRDYRLFRIFEGSTEAVQVYLGSMILRAPHMISATIDRWDVLPEVRELAAAVTELARTRTTSLRQRHVLAGAIGDLACWTVAAALTGAAARRSAMHRRTASWCLRELRRRLYDAWQYPADDLPTGDEIAATIGGYGASIGSLQQRYPLGEYRDLDTLLRD